jgi:peptidoglycan/LPS O-acetylase OafA/YrhL
MINRRALALASVVGTVVQAAMVVTGHTNDSVKGLFAVGGMGISLLAGVLYVLLAPRNTDYSPTLGGLTAGAVCALIGIAVSFGLGDVPASLLALGTISSAVTGAIGGWVTSKLVSSKKTPASAT